MFPPSVCGAAGEEVVIGWSFSQGDDALAQLTDAQLELQL